MTRDPVRDRFVPTSVWQLREEVGRACQRALRGELHLRCTADEVQTVLRDLADSMPVSRPPPPAKPTRSWWPWRRA